MMRIKSWIFGAVFALLSCWFALRSAAQITDPLEVTALQAIRRSLVDPMNNLDNWKRGDPCASKWTGITCNNTGNDGYLHVIELRLFKLNLSGSLAPQLGQLSYMERLNFMWNELSGSIPKEISNITSLVQLVLNGNHLSGSLPDELGYLPNLDLFQIDQNNISGPLPKSFSNLINTRHFHMSNNSISGQIPPELATLPRLRHLLLNNNNLSGYLPSELSNMSNLRILQLDNNHFDGSQIPASFGTFSKLLKLSLRNCSLQGPVPDLSRIPSLLYLDLSRNQLSGSIPSNKLSENITTIDLSNNMLNGSIPSNFSAFPNLQNLSLENNWLSGSVPSTIWQSMNFSAAATLTLDFRNNSLSNVLGGLDPPTNVSIKLQGNPVCRNANELNIVQFCGSETGGNKAPESLINSTVTCPAQSCPADNFFEYVPNSPVACFCAAPFEIGYRLKSPCMSDFRPYINPFEVYITSYLQIDVYQLLIDSFMWEEGPRLRISMRFFPVFSYYATKFNTSEIQRIVDIFATFEITGNDTFGPYELLNITLQGPYSNVVLKLPKSGISKGALSGIVLGSIACAIAISSIIAIFIMKRGTRYQREVSEKQLSPNIPIKIDGVKGFSFGDMEIATGNFSNSTHIGQGSYGNVYKGVLNDGTVVAIKRAREGSLQGQKEFLNEIELLSRLHHRNLVSLIGYCNEEGDQMLIYEFMPNGSLHDILSARSKEPLSFAMRLHIALGSAKGILYLHAEADPPIIHRDIKASNILLDSKLTAKVADFGISKLAPVPDRGMPHHVSTAVKGTPGYLDPEYLLTHTLTDKSDVYSLGIVFLEILTRMQPIMHGKNIVREVTMACQSGKMLSIIDPRMGSYHAEHVQKFLALALKCCQEERGARPSMLEVVRELEDIWFKLPESEISLESVTAFSGTSGLPSTSIYATKNLYESCDISGSDLVSGVIPKIKPR